METSFKQLEANFQRKLNEYQTTYKDYMMKLNEELGNYWVVEDNVTVANKDESGIMPFITKPDISQKNCLHACSTDPKCKYVLFSDSGNGACAANQCIKWTKDANGLVKNSSSPETFSIYVGSSESNPKIVTLPDVGINVSPNPTNPQDPGWNNKFSVIVTGNQLTVTRTDQNSGWGQILQLSGTRPASEANLMMNKACVDGSGPSQTNYVYKGWEKPSWNDSSNLSFINDPNSINKEDWKLLGKQGNLTACKDAASSSKDGPFGSVVFSEDSSSNANLKNNCYGGVPSATKGSVQMEGVNSSIPPMGSTNLGGKSVADYVVKLRSLNRQLTEYIHSMENELNKFNKKDKTNIKKIAKTHKNLMTDYKKLQNDRIELSKMNEAINGLDVKLVLLNRATTREKMLYMGSIVGVLLLLGFAIKRYS